MVRAVWGAGLGLIGLAACAAIAASPPSAETAQLLAQTNRVDHFPTLEAAYPGGIVARPHVEFANYTGYRPLQLDLRSEEHTSELQSLKRMSYAVFCLQKKSNI